MLSTLLIVFMEATARLWATTAGGLESMCAKELENFGAKDILVTQGKVFFKLHATHAVETIKTILHSARFERA